MFQDQGRIIYSPSDLVIFFKSPFASWRDHLRCLKLSQDEPDPQPPEAVLTARLGNEHEARVLETLLGEGGLWDGSEAKGRGFEAARSATQEAMRAGYPALFQPALGAGVFLGYADFLLRTAEPSRFGDYSYEVVDTKLARTPSPAFLIQLCAYADLLEQMQGVRCRRLGVIGGDGRRHWFVTDDYYFYYLALKEEFLRLHGDFNPEEPPVVDPAADHGRWQTCADRALRTDDDLAQVAGLTRGQRRRLREAGVTTMSALAEGPAPPRGMQPHVRDRLIAQARLQRASMVAEPPCFEVISSDERRGLRRLPPASPHDLYFDLEGYPFEEGGLEYLFGCVANGAFDATWAHDRTQEKATFEAFIDRVVEARRTDPQMHVYHYGDYERAAIERLMGRYGTREKEVDNLFAAEVFVNLYRVVQQGLRVGVPSYSLKYVERLYRRARAEEVKTATQSVVEYAHYLEIQGAAPAESAAILEGISRYNQADCESTAELAAWLRHVQAEARQPWIPAPPPRQEPERPRPAQEAEAQAARMLAQPPAWATASAEMLQLNTLLAQLLSFHQREHRPLWWAYFDRQDRSHTELVDDRDCLGGLQRTATASVKVKQSEDCEYCFDPDQETKISQGDEPYLAGTDLKSVKVVSLDSDQGRVVLRFGPSLLPAPNECSLIPDEIVAPGAILTSLMVTAKGWQENGVLPPALRALLLRSPPNFRNLDPGNEVLPPNADPVEVLTDRVLHLDHSVLAIQGPPGTGKTYTAAQIIVGLMRANKRVGVASNNHAAIDKLLVDAVRAARALDVPLRAIRFGREAPEGGVESLRRAADFDPSTPGPLLLAGTAWVFSQATLRDTLDVLIVDEAGQVSLANMVGMAPSAQSLVLVGDQMQLDQPTQAAHPGDSGQSAIQFLLKGHATVPPTLGAFLSETRRLHPELCRFVSDAIYEGRLSARPENGRRVVIARAPEGALVRPSGLVFVPVKHHGNTRESAEEVGEVVRIVDDLLGCERTNQHGERLGPVRPEDILVVAPYNAQVRRLQAALPHVRVGTVDRFQGQEAQVVIISMTTSGDEPPSRGIEFLFSPNRLNVAVSRAQSLAFIVADPRHTRASVANLQAMTRINLFGRLIGARPLRQEEAGL